MNKPNQLIYLLGIMFLVALFPIRTSALIQKTHSDRNVDIVISANASRQEKKAANQLNEYLKAIYPMYKFSVTSVLNENNRTVRLGLPGFLSLGDSVSKEIPLQDEGFLIRNLNEKNVVIVSRGEKGLFNAVYSLLEKLGYGFYLSYDGKPVPKSELTFSEWEMSDFPLQSERLVFNWHNFLSGCAGWNYEDWCTWIDQSAKMRYNTIMVHAYGNNPMFSFEYNGLKKPIGYLTTSGSGRDWNTQHINDVRRLPGGKVFSEPVLGSKVAMVPDEQRGDAATKLMASVFEHANEMAMKINFAIDVDTWSANPRNIIESLPPECRIKLETQDIVNPETADGYQYYKAQIKSLLNNYPQISTITVWVRSTRSLWHNNIAPGQFPKSWQEEWGQLLSKHTELKGDINSASTFALSKVVIAFQRALKEIKREDVTIAFGSWLWNFLPSAAILMPMDCPLIPLDYSINIDSDVTKKLLSKLGRDRKIIPIVWAQHDDSLYLGKPFTPFANFNDLLKECNVSGFGIIHWTTRPLDLFFKSLAEQVWSKSENKSIASTLTDYNRTVFGSQQQALLDYMTEWLVRGPMFGGEFPHFFSPGYKPTEVMSERTKDRIDLLTKVNPSKLSDMGKKTLQYYASMEQFYLSLFQNQDKFSNAYAMLGRQSFDSAKTILQTVAPEKTIELYAKAITILPVTSGEKAMIVEMGTRWLPDFINLKQRCRMADICYKFAKTQHDTLAQSPGTATYFIDEKKTLWSCLGEKELKTGVAGSFSKNSTGDLPENSLTYMKISSPFTLPLVTIGNNILALGKYTLEIKYVNSSTHADDCKLFLVGRNSRIVLKTGPGNSGSKLKTISTSIEIKKAEKYTFEIEPGNDGQQFTNLIIKPL